jgi:hypothetical protein
VKSEKKRTEWKAGRRQSEKGDMLAMLDARLYF